MNRIYKRLPVDCVKDTRLTNKQLSVYYYLILNANLEEINYSEIAKKLKINSINTIKSSLNKLVKQKYISFENNKIKILERKDYICLDIQLIKFLLNWSFIFGAEILLYYSILKRQYELNLKNRTEFKFSIRTMLELIGHNVTDSTLYKRFRLYQRFLESCGLVKTTGEFKTKNGGKYYEYTLLDISQDFIINNKRFLDVNKKIIDELEKSIDFTLE